MLEDIFKAKTPRFNIHNALPVARPGLLFISIGLALTLISLMIGSCAAFLVFLTLTAFTVYFFRDPERPVPPEGFGLSPADGRVIRVEPGVACPLTGAPTVKVSVFMNLFSVHVNRIPVSGRLLRQEHHPGKFLNASFDKASLDNERNCLMIE
jgi:phosphatidylserine decarboxylase